MANSCYNFIFASQSKQAYHREAASHTLYSTSSSSSSTFIRHLRKHPEKHPQSTIDDLGILYSSDKLKVIESNLKTAVNEINAFCTKWA